VLDLGSMTAARATETYVLFRLALLQKNDGPDVNIRVVRERLRTAELEPPRYTRCADG